MECCGSDTLDAVIYILYRYTILCHVYLVLRRCCNRKERRTGEGSMPSSNIDISLLIISGVSADFGMMAICNISFSMTSDDGALSSEKQS